VRQRAGEIERDSKRSILRERQGAQESATGGKCEIESGCPVKERK